MQHDGKGRVGHDDQEDRRDHGRGRRRPHALGAPPHLEPPLTADPGNQHGEDDGLGQARGEVEHADAGLRLLDVGEGGEIQARDPHDETAKHGENVGIDGQDGNHDHGREHFRDGQEPDRVEPHGHQRIDLVVDDHGADLGGEGRSRAACHEDGRHDGPQLANHGDGHEVGHVEVGPELLELKRRHEGHDQPQQQADERHDGKSVGAGPFHVELDLLPSDGTRVRQTESEGRDELPDEGHDLQDVPVLAAGPVAQLRHDVRPFGLGPERRPQLGLPVDEAQKAVVLFRDAEEFEGDSEGPAEDFHFDQGQRSGAVQVLHAGDVEGDSAGLHSLRNRPQLRHEGPEVLEGQAACQPDRGLFSRGPFDSHPVSRVVHRRH